MLMNILILPQSGVVFDAQPTGSRPKVRPFHPGCRSSFCDLIIEEGNPQVYYNNAPLRNFDAIIPRIGSTATDYGAAIIRQFEAKRVFDRKFRCAF